MEKMEKWRDVINDLLQHGYTKRRIAREVDLSETIIYRLMRDEKADLRTRNGDKLRALHKQALLRKHPRIDTVA